MKLLTYDKVMMVATGQGIAPNKTTTSVGKVSV